jgi:hypothetical protein
MTQAGDQLAGRNRLVLASSAVIALAGVGLLLRNSSGGAAGVIGAAAVLATPALVLFFIFRAHGRRRSAATATGFWGSSACLHIDDVRTVPRFTPLLSEVRRTAFTKGWIGGGVIVDDEGIHWTPTSYSEKRRRMPRLTALWADIASASGRPVPGIGSPGILELRLLDGSEWAMNIQGVNDLQAAITRFSRAHV